MVQLKMLLLHEKQRFLRKANNHRTGFSEVVSLCFKFFEQLGNMPSIVLVFNHITNFRDDSIPLSSTPMAMRNSPSSPQSGPQLFWINQYLSPFSSPQPIVTTAWSTRSHS